MHYIVNYSWPDVAEERMKDKCMIIQANSAKQAVNEVIKKTSYTTPDGNEFISMIQSVFLDVKK